MSVVNSIVVLIFVAGWALLVAGLVCFLFAIRELRKLTRQIRHMAGAYFPGYINETADSAAKSTIQTSVEINDVWDEKEEPRG